MRKSSVQSDELFMQILLTRTWLVGAGVYGLRLYGMITQTLPWFMEEKLCDESK